jgi:ferredoxin
MITITKPKPLEEVLPSLGKAKKVYLIGCGTCATICHTGGKSEVLDMKAKLEAEGKEVTGWMVIPTACDELTRDALKENIKAIEAADAILVMSCAFGVQTVSLYSDKPVYPALNTLFVGKEEAPGHFIEVCMQCGNCVLATTVGICPLVRCAKSLLNGPCGGSVDGKCEVSPDTPCAWQLIYDRLKELGQLDKMEEIVPVRDWSTSSSGGPRRFVLSEETND